MEILKKEETCELRKKYIPGCIELFFKNDPLKIVKGSKQYMYDEQGNEYLDCINNVAHVGHCHPHVVKTTSQQMANLETNSRFLHDNLVLYAQRISKYLPNEVDKFFFANSGSECNDLALRIARKVTGAYDVITLDHAYHGHLTSLVDISPYKFNASGGDGQKEWVHVAPVPDSYRGKYRSSEYSDEELSQLYANEVVQLVEKAEKNGRKICLFIAESLQSCGGQITYPKTFLSKVYAYLQPRGILCLADEVQCGFHRSGTTFWGFEIYNSNLNPDFVTMGKSMGNGHPVSCLATKTKLTDKFGEKGLKYFNTYGGNPTSMAAANAVLDVIEQEKLYSHVTNVSTHLMAGLEKLKLKHEIIGDVRGYGYFIGIDFVKNRTTREPATDSAMIILTKMRENFILLSLDGPYSNVMKMKPPLCFNKSNADRVLETLDQVLSRLNLKSKV